MRPHLRGVVPRGATKEDIAVFDADVGRFWDNKFKAMAVKVSPGEHYVTAIPNEMLVTVLGSCVSACIRDPVAIVGGMNHFMLPSSVEGSWSGTTASLRYGNFAMERLINDILKRGGRRERLEIKVFGGGNVLQNGGNIGHCNADFIEAYLAEEGLRIAAHALRGITPRRVHYFPESGKVFMLALQRREDMVALGHEETYRTRLINEPIEGSVELFV